MARRVLLPWNAAALPEIMAESLQGSKRDGAQARCACTVPRRPSSRPAAEALPEREEVEPQKPERGLTLRLTGGPKARPS